MEITGTREAFAAILNVKGVHKVLGVAPSTVSNWKKALAGGSARNMPTLDLMEKMLHAYGADVKREKVWRVRGVNKGDITRAEPMK